jgi:hypothetical protein
MVVKEGRVVVSEGMVVKAGMAEVGLMAVGVADVEEVDVAEVEAEEKEAEREGGEEQEEVEKEGDGKGLRSWTSASNSGEKYRGCSGVKRGCCSCRRRCLCLEVCPLPQQLLAVSRPTLRTSTSSALSLPRRSVRYSATVSFPTPFQPLMYTNGAGVGSIGRQKIFGAETEVARGGRRPGALLIGMTRCCPFELLFGWVGSASTSHSPRSWCGQCPWQPGQKSGQSRCTLVGIDIYT